MNRYTSSKPISIVYRYMKNVLVIDNYDSFTFNLVHYLEKLDLVVQVRRNDQFHLEEVDDFDSLLLSPGPGLPSEAGLLKTLITHYAATKKILGVCLGQQAIAEVFGGKLINLPEVFHGVATPVTQLVEDEFLFKNIPKTFQVGRYHSWVVHPDLPSVLQATAVDERGNVMALRHRVFNLRAVQFHPESILTPDGFTLIKNWVEADDTR